MLGFSLSHSFSFISRGIVQWCIAYKFGDRIIRFGSRTYALLLFSAIFLDIFWNVSSKQYGPLFTFSVKLTLAMQIIGFAVRLSSSLLWIRIYRSGISYMETPVHREISHFGNGDNSSTSGPDVSRSKLSRHFQVADNDGTNLTGDMALIFTHDLTSCRQY
ncbi:uncharacterized protein LOC111483665 isoform X8 [Cucurbita maxima]|uniref:Uncharacterized protein LOC111483665 isoform X8 n=1 Tax=Cucurbita maxima TaxID=3661 RepID=A0A6J1JEC5_CUCMA|nr:uncharacterized protein LOC111483665 isoform X8 [Cucurbita maxima]